MLPEKIFLGDFWKHHQIQRAELPIITNFQPPTIFLTLGWNFSSTSP